MGRGHQGKLPGGFQQPVGGEIGDDILLETNLNAVKLREEFRHQGGIGRQDHGLDNAPEAVCFLAHPVVAVGQTVPAHDLADAVGIEPDQQAIAP